MPSICPRRANVLAKRGPKPPERPRFAGRNSPFPICRTLIFLCVRNPILRAAKWGRGRRLSEDWERIPMKSLAWKLATLAAVIGIGFLVLLQAQRGMNQAMLSKQAESQAAAPAPATTPSEPAVASKNSAEQPPPNAVTDVPSQGEPSSAPESKSPTVPENPKPDADRSPAKTVDSETTPPANTGSSPAGDPFSDFNDAKHTAAAGDAGKPPSPPSLPKIPPSDEKKPAGDVKQASASSQENTSKVDPGPAKTPPVGGPSLTAPPASTTSTAGAPLLDLKAPTGQLEPGDSPPAPANQKNPPKDVAKDTAGPQLFAPGSVPEATAATAPKPKTGDQLPKAGSPVPTADNAKKEPILTAQTKGESDAAPFPALDDEPSSPNGKAATPKTGPKPLQAAQNDSAPHPDPFPVDQA